MTEELFRDDDTQLTCEATLLAVTAAGLELDRTMFYPQGGGIRMTFQGFPGPNSRLTLLDEGSYTLVGAVGLPVLPCSGAINHMDHLDLPPLTRAAEHAA